MDRDGEICRRSREIYVPEDLDGEAEDRPFLARGEAERLAFADGLREVSVWRALFLGGVVEVLFTAFLGDREVEELLPEDEAERERLLEATNRINEPLLFSRAFQNNISSTFLSWS